MFIEAVLWIARIGSPWQDLPKEFGKWNSVFQRYRRWGKAGRFVRIFEGISGGADMEYARIDGSIVKVHRHNQGQKGDPESGHRYIQRRYDDQNTGFSGCFGKAGLCLLPGQRHDICGVEPLIKGREFGVLLADKAFDADWLVKDLTERGSKVVIPPRSNRKAPREYDKEMYKWRHLVENFFCKLKRSRRLPCGQKRRVRLFPPTFIWLPLIVLRQCQQSLIN